MILNEQAIVCPAGKRGEQPIVIDFGGVVQAHLRESEVAIVNKAKAPELLSTFNKAWRDLHDVISKLEAEKNKADREASFRASYITLEVAPQALKNRGLPINAKTIDAIINGDEEYARLCEVLSEIKSVQEFLKGRMKSFENSYNSVKKIMGEEAYNMQRRDQELSAGSGDAAGRAGYQITDKWCAVPNCGERQFLCPSGIVCKNGHGGAPSLNEKPNKPTMTGFGRAKFD